MLDRKRKAYQILAVYLIIGIFISTVQNIHGYLSGEPTALAWTGAIKGNLILIFWWFIVPAVIWPIDIYWSIYHVIGK